MATPAKENNSDKNPFWAMEAEAAFHSLNSSAEGLSENEAKLRRARHHEKKLHPFLKNVLLFLSQFKSPLILLLLFGLILSASVGEFTNAIIIFSILFLSGVLGFAQERNAGKAIEKLRSLIQTKIQVKRDNKMVEIPANDVVPGDVIFLDAGDLIPGDCLILDSTDLYINQAVLTGESFPAEKKAGVLPKETTLFDRKNSVFKGTSVISGKATVLVIQTGEETELGKIETEISTLSEETAFEKGLKKFGYMLMKIALILAGTILIVNIAIGRPALDSILFALALSLGLTPELLPAIVSITLSAGAKRLAAKKVIVKKLSAIQNLGSIDVLCSDKTGTLTEGEIKIHSYLSAENKEREIIKKYAYLNAVFESGYTNPMDAAIRIQSKTEITGYTKFDEVPYDFIRKRLSIVVAHENKHIMITKGALKNIIEVCDKVELEDESSVSIEKYKTSIEEQYQKISKDGYRTIGICYKDVTDNPVIGHDDENKMTFLGFILMNDPPKQGIIAVINELRSKNVSLKIITGDNTLIARNIAKQIGFASERIISGPELHQLSEEALQGKVDDIDIFSETEPSQKERIVRALQKRGHVVGYLGDGINDASALKASDVGISVNNAVDVAKESADLILLEKELSVISEGISEGRKTYLNTIKYILITISANFGNMFSMAGASLLLPFLPMLPSQILLTNFLTDIPVISLASDNVDEEMLKKPRKWDIALIKRFMLIFGLESSLFDFIMFGVLMLIFHSTADLFRSAWFVESVITEVLILLIIRTRRTFFTSKPGKYLIVSSIFVIAIVMVLPYFSSAKIVGLTPIPLPVILAIWIIAIVYSVIGEITKKMIFKRMNY